MALLRLPALRRLSAGGEGLTPLAFRSACDVSSLMFAYDCLIERLAGKIVRL